MNWIKQLFRKKAEKQSAISGVVDSFICGEQDEKGFACLYVNGEETNTKLLIWDKEEVERLQEIGKKIHNEI
jgi:hypothetical protein